VRQIFGAPPTSSRRFSCRVDELQRMHIPAGVVSNVPNDSFVSAPAYRYARFDIYRLLFLVIVPPLVISGGRTISRLWT
jgi:hypothetical protein